MSEKSAVELPLPPALSDLSNLLDDRLESFASGNQEIQLAALNATKYIFEHALATEAQSGPHIVDLLSSLNPAEAPQTRSQSQANKRKRSHPPMPHFNETPLSSLHVENVDPEQVWAQLELRAQGICEMLQRALDGAASTLTDDEEEGGEENHSRKKLRLSGLTSADLEQLGLDAKTLEALAMAEPDSDDEDDDDEEEDDAEEDEDDGDDADLGEDVAELKDPDEDKSSKTSVFSSLKTSKNTKAAKGAHSELDDNFFNLASFNAETEELEAKRASRGRLGNNLEDDDSDSEAESVDYFAPVEVTEDDPETAGSSLLYQEFFDTPQGHVAKPKSPPKSKSTKVRFHEQVKIKNIKAKGRQLPVNASFYWDSEDEEYEDENGDGDNGVEDNDDDDDDDFDFEDEDDSLDGEDDIEEGEEDGSEAQESVGGREAVERLKDDLFDDDNEPDADTTTHQKRVAALREQIESLEAENIAPKNWTLMGEAHARARPQNSLLEEDLEFDRAMKAVPTVTEDVVKELEQRIKTRILDSNFDDVVRRRPLDDKPFLPSRILQLQDTKSSQSLAEIYESEYIAAQTGGVVGEDRDGKLKKEHDEIEKLWDSICNKLDALCNAHFIPKQPKATIASVSNAAAATLESALPTTQAVSTMLAPEEILAPSSSNGPRARSGLTPAEKRALRGKERKMRRKTRDRLENSVGKFSKTKNVKRQKEEALKTVVKNGKGVTVVGKKSQEEKSSKRRRA